MKHSIIKEGRNDFLSFTIKMPDHFDKDPMVVLAHKHYGVNQWDVSTHFTKGGEKVGVSHADILRAKAFAMNKCADLVDELEKQLNQ